jgi:hypothetical protein
MAGFMETLTVKIEGDSSQLQAELDQVREKISKLSEAFSGLGNADQGLSRAVSRLSSMTGPLQNISQLLAQIQSQVQQLSYATISINVAPAISSLMQLSATLAQIMAQMQALTAMQMGGGGFGGGVPFSRVPMGSGMPAFDQGGLVMGRTGIDRIPALLSQGEFVIRSPIVDRLGVNFLERMNQGLLSFSRNVRAPGNGDRHVTSHRNSQIGEVHVHVNQAGEVSDLLQDLQTQQQRMKNRRG